MKTSRYGPSVGALVSASREAAYTRPSGTPSHITMLPSPISSTRKIAGGDQVLRIDHRIPRPRPSERAGSVARRARPALAGDALEHVGGHVEVRVHSVHVVGS